MLVLPLLVIIVPLGHLHPIEVPVSATRLKVGRHSAHVLLWPHLAQSSTWQLMQVLSMVLRVNWSSHCEQTPVN